MSNNLLVTNQSLIESVSLRLVSANAVSESPYTLQRQVQSYGGVRWEADVFLRPLDGDDAVAVQGFLAYLEGRKNHFYLPIVGSGNSYLSTSITGASVNGTQSVGEQTLNITTSSAIAGGRTFSIGNRLHICTNTVGTGNVSLNIVPPLRPASTGDNTSLNFGTPRGIFRLESDVVSWGISNDLKYGFSFSCVEAIDV